MTFYVGCSNDTRSTLDHLINCQQKVVVDKDAYANDRINEVWVTDAVIEDDCLIVNFNFGGCGIDGAVFDLFDSESVAESFPVQRFIKLRMKNPQPCAAIIKHELRFDVSELRVGGSTLLLNLDTWDRPIVYTY